MSPLGVWLLTEVGLSQRRGGEVSQQEPAPHPVPPTHYLATLKTIFFRISSHSCHSCACEHPGLFAHPQTLSIRENESHRALHLKESVLSLVLSCRNLEILNF